MAAREYGDVGGDEPDPDDLHDLDDSDGPAGSDVPPAWFPGQHLPEDARRIGLTAHVPDGALLDFAGSLDAARPLHRFAAWMLLVVFGLPVVFAVLRLWFVLFPGQVQP